MATYCTDLVSESVVSQGLAVFWFNILLFFPFPNKDDFEKDGWNDSNANIDESQKRNKEEKLGHVKKTEIIKISNTLKRSRKKNWSERANRIELEQLLQKESVDGKVSANPSSESQPLVHQPMEDTHERRNESIYKLQLDCGLESDDIIVHCAKLRAKGPLLSWGIAKGKFNNLPDAFEWSCLNGKEELKQFFVSLYEVPSSIPNQLCTFRDMALLATQKIIDKKNVLRQLWYNCKDCNLVEKNVCCNVCAKICHANHELTFADYSKSFSCNCGANEDGSCFALNLPQVNDICTFNGTKYKNVLHHIFTCQTCNWVEICSRCIKTCHKSHGFVYKGLTNTYCGCECKFKYEDIISNCQEEDSVEPLISWVNERFTKTQLGLLDVFFQWSCRNGKDDLTEYLISHSEELGTQFYRTCTFRLTTGKKTKLKQVWYTCHTCNINNVCHACTKICHADHDIAYVNYISGFFCNCGAKKDCAAMILPQDSNLCTLTSTTRILLTNHYYGCLTCDMTKSNDRDICTSCVKKCHKDHQITYQGVRNAACDCGIEKYGECQALVSSNGEKIVVINDGKW